VANTFGGNENLMKYMIQNQKKSNTEMATGNLNLPEGTGTEGLS
jgi:hypothetical protein